MESSLQSFPNSKHPGGPVSRRSTLPDHWRMARAAHVDLLLMGLPRVNLLLIAPDGVVRYVLESLLLDLQEPVARWRPGDDFAPPAIDEGGTFVLHEAGTLAHDQQIRMLDWLERMDGRMQVVTTSSTPLLPRVQAGGFIEVLYYRLNTVCVDVVS
jgi:hypothetical protein